MVTPDYIEAGRVHILQDKEIPPYVRVFRIHGPFLFGATDKIARITDNLAQLPPIVIFRLRNMTAIDATGLRALEDVAEALRAAGRTLIVCGAREQPADLMRAAEFHRHLGDSNICPSIQAALARAREIYGAMTAEERAALVTSWGRRKDDRESLAPERGGGIDAHGAAGRREAAGQRSDEQHD
jgi:SulP family sulfate permease